jgi:membrane dipeptidase
MRSTPTFIGDAHHQMWNRFVQEALAGGERVFDTLHAPCLRASGVRLVNIVVGRGHTAKVILSASDLHFWDTNKGLDLLLSEEEQGAESFILCRTSEDIDRVLAEDKIAVVASIAGGRVLEGKPNLNLLSSLRNLYRFGLRGVQLTGNGRNRLADGAGQARTGSGLTSFGVVVVHEIERLGMVIDTAQLSDSGFWDVMEETTGPIIDSHSCARAVCDFPRNIADTRIKAIAGRGGLVGLSFWAVLVNGKAERPTVDDLLRHVDHITELVGTDHIALGPDFCAFDTRTPSQREQRPGWIEGVDYGLRASDYIRGPNNVTKLSLVAEALSGIGYAQEEIDKFLSGNLLRLYKQVLR